MLVILIVESFGFGNLGGIDVFVDFLVILIFDLLIVVDGVRFIVFAFEVDEGVVALYFFGYLRVLQDDNLLILGTAVAALISHC